MFKKTAVFLSILTITAITLILTGWFDPQPYGELLWEQELSPIIVPARSERIVWVDEVVDEPFSVRLTAVFDKGNLDSRYGLLIGDVADNLSITISPTGYAAIEQGGAVLVPYAPFTHVHRDDINGIWVDVDGDAITVRLNRELFWQGQAVVDGGLGVLVENFGDGEVSVDFQTLSLFAPQSQAASSE